MGFFGLVGLLCGRTDSGRRANCYRMARDVREDPGDSDAHLLANSRHLGQRPATGSGSGRSLGDHRDDAPENGSKKLDDRHGVYLRKLFFLCLRRELGVGPGRCAPAGARTLESSSPVDSSRAHRGGDRGRFLRRAHVCVSKPASQRTEAWPRPVVAALY